MHIKKFLLGAGGHGKVVYSSWKEIENTTIMICDNSPDKIQEFFLDGKIIQPFDLDLIPNCGHVAIGNNNSRRQMYELLYKNGKEVISIFDQNANISKFCKIDSGSFVAAGSTLSSCATVGKGVIINHNVVVDHDCKVGDYSHIAPGAILGGEVRIGKECIIGSGAVILPGIQISDGVLVGSGSVVTKDINKKNIVVFGAPAKTRGVR